MTLRPLTDDQLAAGLRAHLPVAHAAMHERVRAEVTTTPQDRRMPSILGRLTDADPMARRRTMLLVALVALALTVSVAGVAGALLRDRTLPEPLPPDLSVVPPPATAGPGEVVHGWPSTTQNAAGLYSWDGHRCSQGSCTRGFMHNGYGSGDVDIWINHPSGGVTDDGAIPVTVAGHAGTYRRMDDRREAWVVDIEGTPVTILLIAEPGASQADLADAHAIIASMYTEPAEYADGWGNANGFRLVFRLTNDEWDSG
jgi:hypothetical protein